MTQTANGAEQPAMAPAQDAVPRAVEPAREMPAENAVSEPIKVMEPAPRMDLMEPSGDLIRAKAYEIFMRRGGGDGHDLEDWLVAERELRALKY